MQTQFKDLKQGDIISHEGALFELCAPNEHIFGLITVYTIRAKFIERRAISKIVSIFNKRERLNIELEKGLSLQGFRTDTLDVVEPANYLMQG